MHPPLYRPHPRCEDIVAALVKCHDENPSAKFWGACNDAKAAMDACFKLEKDEKRRANLAKARAFDERRRQKHGDDAVGRAPPAS
mmetsp:Transcript_35654/g.110395  ORF Transcript_35654/g.110395 Transcript_35654/m.110395 type:complete len:85 (-) Transcript_35654:126-380(-)